MSRQTAPRGRLLAAFLATTAVLQLHPAIGAPGDIFTLPAPVIGADPPKATDIKDGDASVSTQTGALQFSYPIQLPPGRNGVAPQLSLGYSSQAPTYGGIASGWTLSIPAITEDHSVGRLRTRSSQIEQQQIANNTDPKTDDRFTSSLAGGRPLVAVTEPTGVASDVYMSYRAQNDTTYARYERMLPTAPYRWRVRTTDGQFFTFGESARLAGCTVNDQYAPLTGVRDQFNNEIRYDYSLMPWGECAITRISWGQNLTTGAPLPDFAQVTFTYKVGSACNGIYPNTQTDYRSGFRVLTGAGRVESIIATAYTPGTPTSAVHTRRIDLGYDDAAEACTGSHAPIRLLTSIRETASGTDSPVVALPAVTFSYSDPTVSLVSPQGGGTTAPWGTTPDRQNLGWGYRRIDDRWPTVESMFLDVDGDGLQDLVVNDSGLSGTISNCSASWYKNPGQGTNGQMLPFALQGAIALPRLKWRGVDPQVPGGATQAQRGYPNNEGCSLNGQVTAFENAHVNGTACHNPLSPVCTSATDPTNPSLFCFPGGTYCPPDPGYTPGGRTRTYLAYRWLDADSDGLPDLVAAPHGDYDYYDIERGNDAGFESGEPSISGIPGVGQWPACTGVSPGKKLENCLDERGARTCTSAGCTIDWSKVLTCLAVQPTTGTATLMKAAALPTDSPGARPSRAPYMRCEGLYPWLIYKNLGNGQFATSPSVKYQPVPLESNSGDSSFSSATIASESHAVMDFDGDGWLDALVRETKADGTGSYAWQLWLGDGTGGFASTVYVFPTRSMNCAAPCNGPGDNAISGIGGVWGQAGRSTAGLLDVNGDGAQDHWLALDLTGNANVAFNDGQSVRLFGSTPTGEVTTAAPGAGYNVKPGNDTYVVSTDPVPVTPGANILKGETTARTRVADVDQDGRLDIVSFNAPNTVPKVFFNAGGNFVFPGTDYPGDVKGITRRTIANTTGDSFESLMWALNADLMDLDGDGIQESVYFGTTGFLRALPADSQPPRVLQSINNGRGRHTVATYASMHDPLVVVQHPELTWPDGRPKASPRAQWVVKQLQDTDDIATTSGTSSYSYLNPAGAPMTKDISDFEVSSK